jgi:hypothetical protein
MLEERRFAFGPITVLQAWVGLALTTVGPLALTIVGIIERVPALIGIGVMFQLLASVLAISIWRLITRGARNSCVFERHHVA